MNDLDPKVLKDLRDVVNPDSLDALAQRALSDMLGRKESSHVSGRRAFWAILTVTLIAYVAAIGLSVLAVLKTYDMDTDLLKWLWGGVFSGTLGSTGMKAAERLKGGSSDS